MDNIKNEAADGVTKTVALIGNPNVGKSTIFNALTGMHQHTGNWPGKTVATAQGEYRFNGDTYKLIDLPGSYSLCARSAEEEVSRDYIQSGEADAVVIVCDATCLERNLNLLLQILGITRKVVACVNLLDEAERKGIKIDLDKLSECLGIPVIGTTAAQGKGIEQLIGKVAEIVCSEENTSELCNNIQLSPEDIWKRVARVVDEANIQGGGYSARDRKIDSVLTNKATGIPIMLATLLGIFWITITGANYPSQLLSTGLFALEDKMLEFCMTTEIPKFFYEVLILGVYRVVAWVIAVMLPPMAIFFPLFTLLEDLGYLPRIAFNLDKYFKKCSACGKQALTMCMGKLMLSQGEIREKIYNLVEFVFMFSYLFNIS
ncbi:FeoB small GTPase domain-containing protein [Aminipila sp.]|uniref:FeoB small GTPase domain-containing protein n=1 Tax=Aminipila sp. TaxID=2060095 RepID=UPI00289BAA87|nr:FeoB small GTPase domain-containing protein [Aminipila sp.]